jgi:APA family basic amino acid/polyamine antiporter
MYKLGWINWARLAIWLVIGLVIYFSYSRHHSRLQHGDTESDTASSPPHLVK